MSALRTQTPAQAELGRGTRRLIGTVEATSDPKGAKKSAEPMPTTNAYLPIPKARPCRIADASRTQFLPACFAVYKPASAAFTSSSRVLP
jgi:hypothetical protein